jgi:hypothetical protein
MKGDAENPERHVFIFSCWDADSAHKVGWTVDMVNGNGCSRFVSVPGGRLLARAAHLPLVKKHHVCGFSEKSVRWAHLMQVGPCIPAGIQL